MSDAKNYIYVAIDRESKHSYKEFLSILELIREQHSQSFGKLLDVLPKEYHGNIAQASFFDEKAYGYFRKKVLDRANDSMREIQRELDKYEVDFKK